MDGSYLAYLSLKYFWRTGYFLTQTTEYYFRVYYFKSLLDPTELLFNLCVSDSNNFGMNS